MTGAELIARERERQVQDEGFTADGDDRHAQSELLTAALCYVGMAGSQLQDEDRGREAAHELQAEWPWAPNWWKPCDDPARNLVKAGALIAAEIDRLQRRAA
jgi:hypothetical protein